MTSDARPETLEGLIAKWRAREMRWCRMADGQPGTMYADRLANQAETVATCADELEALLAALAQPSPQVAEDDRPLVAKLREGRVWLGKVSISSRSTSARGVNQEARRRLDAAIREVISAMSQVPSEGEAPPSPQGQDQERQEDYED